MSSPAITPTPSIPAPAPPKRRRWLRVTIVVLAAALIVPVALFVYFDFSARQALENAEAEAARDLPRWRLAELQEDRKKFANHENSALHIIAVTGKGKGVYVSGVPKYNEIFEDLPPTAQLNDQQIRIIHGELDKIVAPLKGARKLKDMRYGRFPIVITDDYIGTLIPDYQNARQLGDWLGHDALRRAQDEEFAEAVDSCRACLNAGRAVADDPFSMAFLIRAAIGEIGIESLEHVVAQAKDADDASYDAALKEMQALLELEAKECNLLSSIRGERAGYSHLFENIRSGKIRAKQLQMMGFRFDDGGSPITAWWFKTFPTAVLKYYPDYLQHLNELVKVIKLPRHERSAKIAELELSRVKSGNLLMQQISPYLSKIDQVDTRHQVRLRAAAAGVACERYRLKHGNWPASLDALVKEGWLSAVPIDPLDDQPMRFRATPEGIVIYSIGFDRKDNGGIIKLNRMQEADVDIGFRLWNPAMRRQAPRPMVAVDDLKN